MSISTSHDERPAKRRRRRRTILSNTVIRGLVVTLVGMTANAQIIPSARWGQASAISGTTLLVHGGKVDPSNSMSYTSAPNTNDLFSLDLSTSFDVANPPWVYESGSQDASTSQGPSVAWHSLTSYSNNRALVFGGDGGPDMPIETNADSAWILNSNSFKWTWETANWAGEPIRRMYHSAASSSKSVWITGGQKADGSGIAFQDTIEFSGSGNNAAFVTLPAPNGTLPLDLLGHRSIMLPSGMLFVLGGYSPSQSALISMSVLHYLDTTSNTPTWGNLTLQGEVPSPRRNFAIALLSNNQILIHGGGDATLQNLYSDGAILNLQMTPISWVSAPALDGTLGALIDHMAIGVGNSVLFGFGRGPNGPGPAGLNLYNSDSGTFSNSYDSTVNSPTQTELSTPSSTIPGYTSAATWPATVVTGVIPGQSSTVSTRPSQTLGPGGVSSDGDHTGHNKATVIALSTIFGVGAIAGLLLLALWLLFRRRRGSSRDSHLPWDPRARHHPLPGSGDSEDPELLGSKSVRDIPVVGGRWADHTQTKGRWGFLPTFNRRGTLGQSRFDMFHDEDARSFGHTQAATGSSMAPTRPAFRRFGSSTRNLWNGVLNASTASFKALGRGGDGATTPAADNRHSSPDWWEKTHDPFADDAVAMAAVPSMTAMGMNASRQRGSHSQGTSYGSLSTYNDPFTDELGAAHSRMSTTSSRGYYSDVGRADSFQPFLLPIDDEPPLSSLRIPSSDSGAPSRNLKVLTPGLLTPGTLASSEFSNYMSMPSSTPTSVESSGQSGHKLSTPGLLPSMTSLIGSAPATPIKRSDSWWDRFGRTSLSSLTRQVSGGDRGSLNPIRRISVRNNGPSNAYAALDFRDPNPPPRLSGIEETGKSNQPSPENSADAKKGSGGTVDLGGFAHHRKSLSSMKTADSEALERMAGRLDVMQRGRTTSSDVSLTPAGSINEDYEYGGARLVTVHGAAPSASSIGDRRPPHRHGTSSNSQLASPPSTDSPGVISSPGMSTEETYQTAQSRPGAPQRESSESYKTAQSRPSALNPPQRRQTGKGVADRVAVFEGMRLTQSPPTSPVAADKFPSNRGADVEAKRKSVGISYGLAQRPSLFVANPDRRIGSGSTTSDTVPPAS